MRTAARKIEEGQGCATPCFTRNKTQEAKSTNGQKGNRLLCEPRNASRHTDFPHKPLSLTAQQKRHSCQDLSIECFEV